MPHAEVPAMADAALPLPEPISPEDLLDAESEKARADIARRISQGERPLLEDAL